MQFPCLAASPASSPTALTEPCCSQAPGGSSICGGTQGCGGRTHPGLPWKQRLSHSSLSGRRDLRCGRARRTELGTMPGWGQQRRPLCASTAVFQTWDGVRLLGSTSRGPLSPCPHVPTSPRPHCSVAALCSSTGGCVLPRGHHCGDAFLKDTGTLTAINHCQHLPAPRMSPCQDPPCMQGRRV